MGATGAAAAGIAALAFSPGNIVLIVIGAVLQGAAVSWCIGTTNLLAVGHARAADMPVRKRIASGAGLRIASSNIIPCIGSFVLPLMLAQALGLGGAVLLFSAAAVIVVVLGVTAYAFARRVLTENNQGRGPADPG